MRIIIYHADKTVGCVVVNTPCDIRNINFLLRCLQVHVHPMFKSNTSFIRLVHMHSWFFRLRIELAGSRCLEQDRLEKQALDDALEPVAECEYILLITVH
jgi:hypothetical protein